MILAMVFTNSTVSFAQPETTKAPAENTQNESQVVWPKAPNVEASSAIVMEVSTGTILYEKNIYEKHYPASITKILTGLIAIENSSLDDMVTFSYNSVHDLEYGSTHIGMREGEKITMNSCLHALLLASANEVANAMAEHVGKDKAGFAKMMNEYAKSYGCKNSNFVNPSGLHDDNHYTCAYDMALISRQALFNETFRIIDSTRTYIVPATNLVNEDRYIAHKHQMFMGNKKGFTQYKYEGCFGGKTGYTDTARNTLVTFAERNGMELICVVMETSLHGQYTDSTALLDYGFNNYTKHSITELENTSSAIDDNSELFTRYFSICDITNSLITIGSDASLILPVGVPYEKAEKEIEYYDDISLTTGSNIIGKISYTYGGKNVGQTNIIMNCDNDILSTKVELPENLKTDDDDEDDTNKDEEDEGFLDKIPFKKILISIGVILLALLVIRIIMVILYRKRRAIRRRYNRYRRFISSKKASYRSSKGDMGTILRTNTKGSYRGKKKRKHDRHK